MTQETEAAWVVVMSDQCSDHILSPEDNCTAAPPRTPPSLPVTACSPLQRPHCSHVTRGQGTSWRPSSGDYWGDVMWCDPSCQPAVLITAFVICPLASHWLLPNCAAARADLQHSNLGTQLPGPGHCGGAAAVGPWAPRWTHLRSQVPAQRL